MPHLRLITSPEPREHSEDSDNERTAWALVADGCERAVSLLPLDHPERPAFLAMLAETTNAAGHAAGRA